AKILDTRLPYPLIADVDKKVSELYGMIHPGESSTVTVRALFFIDPKATIRAIIYYPLNVGRNVDEILRVADALQTADAHSLAKILDMRLPCPRIPDVDKTVSERYGMIHPGESSTVSVRALFFIDPKATIRATICYPLNVGRNADEILRVADALQTADAHSVACPVNWKKGDKVIVPPPKTEKEVEARNALSNVERLDFYLVKKSL